MGNEHIVHRILGLIPSRQSIRSTRLVLRKAMVLIRTRRFAMSLHAVHEMILCHALLFLEAIELALRRGRSVGLRTRSRLVPSSGSWKEQTYSNVAEAFHPATLGVSLVAQTAAAGDVVGGGGNDACAASGVCAVAVLGGVFARHVGYM